MTWAISRPLVLADAGCRDGTLASLAYATGTDAKFSRNENNSSVPTSQSQVIFFFVFLEIPVNSNIISVLLLSHLWTECCSKSWRSVYYSTGRRSGSSSYSGLCLLLQWWWISTVPPAPACLLQPIKFSSSFITWIKSKDKVLIYF